MAESMRAAFNCLILPLPTFFPPNFIVFYWAPMIFESILNISKLITGNIWYRFHLAGILTVIIIRRIRL